MIKVGLTGGIAVGKSTVANILVELGAHLIDFDIIARDVVDPHLPAWDKVVEYFGNDILFEDLSINRQKLAQIVFNDKQKLQKLNEIIHPAAFDEAHRMMQAINVEDKNAIIIVDAPLLIETGYHKSVKKIIVVVASKENQMARLVKQGYTVEHAEGRMAAQLPVEEKIKFADYIITNDGIIQETREQVEKVFNELRLLTA